jgi:hypothetical protein
MIAEALLWYGQTASRSRVANCYSAHEWFTQANRGFEYHQAHHLNPDSRTLAPLTSPSPRVCAWALTTPGPVASVGS